MARTKIDVAGFDAMFKTNTDPWNYRSSRFEAFKRKVLLQACGGRQFGRGLELACANGETTLALARKCLKLLAVDGSPTAVAEAQRRTAGLENVVVRQATLPHDMPLGSFDLIVISELLYYLERADFRQLLAKCQTALAPGGRIVILHHTIFFDDVAVPPAQAQQLARSLLTVKFTPIFRRSLAHFDVAAFKKPIR